MKTILILHLSKQEIRIFVNTKIIVGEAFYRCTSLSTIYYTGNIESWLNKDWHSSIMSSGRTLYINNVKTEGELTIPDGVTTIPSYAFAYQNITSVIVPDSVKSIGSSAFRYCDSLASVTIGNGVTSIGDSAFYSCTSLTSITVDENNTAYASIDGNLYNKDKTTLIQYATGKTATEFTIPDSVTVIGDEAFAWCPSLTSIVIPDSVTSIGDWAFTVCPSLTSIVIPDSVTSIEMGAFTFCSSLISIDIPDSVTSIGDMAFESCDSLTDVYYAGTEEQWNGISIGSFNEDLTSAIIHFPDKPETETEGLSYELNADNTGYTVTGIGSTTDTIIIIPSEY